jgi:hypothetical protein
VSSVRTQYLLKGEPCRSIADPDAVRLDNPELLRDRFRRENGNKLLDDFQHPRLVLPDQPKYHNARGTVRWVGLDIGEVQIQGHEHAMLFLADLKDSRILLAAQRLVEDADGIVTVLAKELRFLLGQILVDLESHAALRPGNSTIRSRASSAA